MLIARMLAPVLGAMILKVADWKMTFIVLAIITGVSLVGAFFYYRKRYHLNMYAKHYYSNYSGLKVANNPNFSSLLLVGAFISAPFMAYLALASYIYIDGFGVWKQYSLCISRA